MNRAPTVSVAMPLHNAARHLRPAIESILAQTFSDFEFIIVDDGSTDSTAAIVREFADTRIRFVCKEHCGLVASLNHALQLARGEFIARMDGDDLSHRRRLEKQVAFLRANPEHGIVGTTYAVIDAQGKTVSLEAVLLDDEDLRAEIAVRNPFAHGSVMLPRSALEIAGGYHDVPCAEDWDLWLRISQRWKMANLPEVLYSWRITASSILHTRAEETAASARALQQREFLRRRDAGTDEPPSIPSALKRRSEILARRDSDSHASLRVRRLASVYRGQAAVRLDFAQLGSARRLLQAARAIEGWSRANCLSCLRWVAACMVFWNPRLVNDLAFWMKRRFGRRRRFCKFRSAPNAR